MTKPALQFEPVWDEERQSWYIGDTPTHRIEVLRMLFNDRVVLTPHHCLMVYDYGWCYDRGTVWMAMAQWHPEEEAEPPGFKKRVGPQRVLEDEND